MGTGCANALDEDLALCKHAGSSVENLVAIEGRKFRLIWACESNGKMPAREFVLAQSPKNRAKLVALFGRLADFGVIHNREKFKKLEDDLWEFKSFQIRVLGAFRPNGIFVLAHGVTKKKDELSPSDIEIAKRILREHDKLKTTKRPG